MKGFKITGRNLPENLSTAATVMTAVSPDRMMGKKNRDKLDIRIRFKHHTSEGEAIPLGKYKYDVIIDHHRITHDAWGREFAQDERIAKIVNFVGHEMVHVWQYFKGDLILKNKKLYHHNLNHTVNGDQEYFDLPFEEEARGKEEGHMYAFLVRWKQLQEEGIV